MHFNYLFNYYKILQITDEGRNVFAIEVPEEQLDSVSRNMYSHLRTLITERDDYMQVQILFVYWAMTLNY